MITINHSKKTISFWRYYHVLLPYLFFPIMVPTSHSSCQKFHLTPQIISFAAQKRHVPGHPICLGWHAVPCLHAESSLHSSSLGIRSWSSHVGFMAEFNVGGCLTFETTQMSFISSFTTEMMVKSPFLLINSQAFLPGALRQRLQTPEQLLRIDVPQLASQHLAGCEKLGVASFHVWPIKMAPMGVSPFWIFWCNCRFYTQVGVVVHWSSFAHWDQFVCGNHAAYTPYAVFSSTSGKGHQAVVINYSACIWGCCCHSQH